jgi:cell division protein FtsZ
MADAGFAHMGVGSATGKDKAEEAARAAISSPLLETSIKGATGIVISISASPDIGLEDVDIASTMIANEANPEASVIWGVAFDPELEDEMHITIIATGFTKKPEDEKLRAVPARQVPQPDKESNAPKTAAREAVQSAYFPKAEAAPAPAPVAPAEPDIVELANEPIEETVEEPAPAPKPQPKAEPAKKASADSSWDVLDDFFSKRRK